MARREEVTYDVEDVVGVLSESDTSDWAKVLARISWNGSPAKWDIRNMNLDPNPKRQIFPKGISLNDEEVDRLTDLLLEQDFGSMDCLESALKRKQSRFTLSADMEHLEDKLIIEIPL